MHSRPGKVRCSHASVLLCCTIGMSSPPTARCLPLPAPLPADDTHGVTDLSGDSGAIGRLTMGGTKEDPQMQIDLKGEGGRIK